VSGKTTDVMFDTTKAFEIILKFDVCLSVHRCICVEKRNQLAAAEWFIALVICSTCFGHLYAHHQELETILVLLPHMVRNALVAGGRRSGAGQQAMRPGCGLEQLPSSHHQLVSLL